jgi:hypothetical protein
VIGLEPIEDNRGPGRRTLVYVEEVGHAIVASRTENSILASMAEAPREVMEATAALELLQDLLDDLDQIGPMLRKSIKKEANLDLDRLEKRIQEILNHEIEFDTRH